MTIDISKIKPGDKVTLVPLGVVDVVGSSIRLRFEDTGSFYVAHSHIAAHHPAPREIGVGDRVRWKDLTGTVRAVDGQQAWVRWDDHEANWSAEIQALTLVEGDHERA